MSAPRRGLLTLSMIVKDEALTLSRTLASVKPFIDRWVILDTGSTDGTQDLIRRELDGVPGAVFEEPFVDFSTSRNRALELAGEVTEFVMWLDADDVIVNGAALRSFLERMREERAPEHEAYYLRIEMGVHFDSPRIARTRARWRFRGVVHEILMHPDRDPPKHRVPDARILHEPGADSAERSRRRWERDAKLLGDAAERDPKDTRTAFYLALTYLWLGRHEEAEAAFHRRIALGGWAEEIYESKMALARIAAARGLPWPETQARYLDAHAFAPHRAEPLFAIALHYDSSKQYALSFLFARRGYEIPLPVKDSLFVDESVYTWKLADLVATAAYWIGELEIGEAAARAAIRNNPHEPRLVTNLGFYLDRKRGA
ncbi:Glycosyl transferase, group 2 family protein [Minicystis rosea]|nr:Glycosyl transferase, group 2 family protein [Minicystis rosea]